MDHEHHSMDGMGGMGMSNDTGSNNTTTMMHGHSMLMHMTFFWGSQAEILFAGWPGTHTGMYVLSLFVTFALAVLVELISHSNFIKQDAGNRSAGLVQTLLHGLRMALSYLVMLAVMSFNVGVFLAAVVGHVVGFLIFGSRFFKTYYPAEGKTVDLPPMSC
ncbi:unnamed protein product [Rhodiola kirilowii]